MTQEDKELLLKDLCSRLPYEVILLSSNGKVTYQTDGNTAAELLVEEGWKPYLRPMSSIASLISAKEWSSLSGTELIDWYNANHIDYRGLIEKGLAIAVTEDNNPYKEE